MGIATQNPELRKRYTGKPEFVVNFFEYIAEEVRELLASLGLKGVTMRSLPIAGVVATPADAPSFAAIILGMEEGTGLPETALADTGFASGEAAAALESLAEAERRP